MSDIDRVFARMGGGQTAGGDRRELRRVPRKGGSSGSRVVEVVRLPAKGCAANAEPLRRTDLSVRAETWDDVFPARSATPPPSSTQPIAEKPPKPIAHVMPARERTVVEAAPEVAPPAPFDAGPPLAKRSPKAAQRLGRRIADPFNPDDDGANCRWCGYLIEPSRERRGLMTCAECG